jgi:adenylate cyclase
MNMVHMLLEGKFFVSDNESTKYSWILLAIGSTLIVGIMLLGHAILDFVAVNAIIFGFLYLDTFYFIPRGYNLRLFFCLFSVVFCYSWSTFLHFYQSNKEKKKIKGTFSRYLAPSIVNDLLKNPEKLRLGGEKKNITVFFSDVRDFTSISEKLTPEQLTLCLNKYMTMMTNTLFEHNGTLDKYIGDAMVAYWGAPVELENHSYWALKGAIAMIERLPAINEEFAREGFPTFKHGIGLNTGDCSVGNMGSNQIFSYTALGDNMNLGARLESLCKFYGVQLNVSEYTKNSLPSELAKEFTFRTLDKVKVKGKEKALTIYEVLHPSHHLYNDKETLALYEESFSLYLNMKFTEASVILEKLFNLYPEDKTFSRMRKTCHEFIEVPPPIGWDGTYTHLSK